MANTTVYNELSVRVNKFRRPDSGIHTSIELPNEVDKNVQKDSEEQVDSGRDSDHGAPVKKSGLLKNFKKIFKRKKKSKNDQRNSSESIGDQYRAKSESDILSEPHHPPFKRYNSAVVKHTLDGGNTSSLMTDDDELSTPEKKNSIKEAQQKIRSSLRKLKMKRNKPTEDESPTPDPEVEVNIEKTTGNSKKEERANSPNTDYKVEFNDTFYNSTVTEGDKSIFLSPSTPVNFGDISNINPKIESSFAKDKIRIAPRDRRKPSKFRNAPQKGASFLSISDVSKSSVSDDRSPQHSRTSLHDSNEFVGNRAQVNSDNTDLSNQTKRISKGSRPASIESKEEKVRSSSEIVTNKSVTAHRSQSTNSRENINFSRLPKKPSTYKSMNGLDNDTKDRQRFSRSVGALHEVQSDEIFYNNKDSKEIIEDGLFAKSFHKRQSQYDNIIKNLGNVKNKIIEDSPRRSEENITNVTSGDKLRGSKKDVSYGKKDDDSLIKRSQDDIRKIWEDTTSKNKDNIFYNSKEDISKKSNEHISGVRNSPSDKFGATFAITSPSHERKYPNYPTVTERLSKSPVKSEEQLSSSNDQVPVRRNRDKRPRPQSVRIRATEVNDDKKEVVYSSSRSTEDISAVGRSIKPITKEKPVTSPRMDNISPRDKSLTTTDDNNQFNRMSLKKVPKTNDFLEKREPTLSSSEKNNDFSKISFKDHSNKDDLLTKQQSESTALSSTQHTNNFDKIPAKNVSKKEDFVVKQNDLSSLSSTTTSNHKEDVKILHSRSKSLSSNRPKKAPVPTPTSSVNDDTEKFSFQSKDVVNISRSKSLSAAESKRLKVKSPTNEENVPEWIKIANKKQTNEETSDKQLEKEENNPEPPQVNLKPAVQKRGPKTEPKPSAQRLSSPPSSSSMPPPTSQMVTPSRATSSFNANKDITTNQCMVCGRVAYMFERCEVNKRTLHKSCAKCDVCNRTLKVGGIFINNEKVYCSNHKI